VSNRTLPIAILVAFALLIVLFIRMLPRDPSILPSPYIDKAAPAFDLPALKRPDVRVNNASFAGGPALINVWATWCVGCREEHPFLMQLAEENPLPIYGINWRDDRATALSWLDQFGDPYVASGFDGDGRVGIDWGVYGAPETFLVDAEGTVLHKHLGPLTREAWNRDFLPRIDAVEATR